MYNNFFASQSVELLVPEQPFPICDYLNESERIVKALADPNRIKQIAPDIYSLRMRPLKFFMLKIEPIVDMKIWTTPEGIVNLKSVGCQLKGMSMINEHFQINLSGKMQPYQTHEKTYLKGKAELGLKIFLPSPFNKIPKSILLSTGNSLLGSILLKMKQGLMQQLLLDYGIWAEKNSQNLVAAA
ncbi:MAG: DUF1997 domain-containing protein [Microcoleaceae cyanobacterium MO_207.B10]|nr:DUF1997 domain-containing protein [Microcoleaceae cyanobacterium MO_207.B10]